MQNSVNSKVNYGVRKCFVFLAFWYSVKSYSNTATYAFLQIPSHRSVFHDVTEFTNFSSKKEKGKRRENFYRESVMLQSKSDGNDSEVEKAEESQNILPGLPPIGASSYDSNDTSKQTNKDGSKNVGFVGNQKFELQYTCKICETRNVHKVSRIAYRKGVVIAVCKGCMAKHLIADNLGWSDYIGGFDGETNIEEYMEANGRGDEVNRVSEEVFGLEQILDITQDSVNDANEDEKHFE